MKRALTASTVDGCTFHWVDVDQIKKIKIYILKFAFFSLTLMVDINKLQFLLIDANGCSISSLSIKGVTPVQANSTKIGIRKTTYMSPVSLIFHIVLTVNS